MTHHEFSQICNLTLELIKLRQQECSHLCIENYAPEIFGRLLMEYRRFKHLHDSDCATYNEPAMPNGDRGCSLSGEAGGMSA